ncbi:trehalose-phosphatase [Urbifossiella limnaea]|uniref:Trehalose 6-phosphate phosphatase n=1 Tax=Urbifossiella limnaea TaxID=2528023 RepID=A0A517XPH9_9BACT|nr:trehalose-phosphatase [Urbifossiella limnaea]QDU19408.1 Trehalose-phosphate phosphatase [Urbifossiella limnaea]
MPAHDWATAAAAGYRAGRPLTLLFDYDGTLTPIAALPALAVLPPATRDALAGLAALPRAAVGVVSGRSLDSVRELVGLPGLRYAGSGGMHISFGAEEAIDPALAEFDAIADALLTALSSPVKSFPGTWVERKPGCLSVHYRQLTPPRAAGFVEEAREALAELAPDCPPLRVRAVTQALEVALAGAWTKGDAVDRLAGVDALVVFAGDGANDEEAVAAVNARGGLTVGVGPEAPAAVRLRVADQNEFVAGLHRLAASLCGAAVVGRPHPGGVVTPRVIHQGAR